MPKLIPLDDSWTVAFAIKREGDRECYHWNDQSYAPLRPMWLNPDWKLEEGNYLVRVVLTGYRLVHPVRADVRMSNNGSSISGFTVKRVKSS